MLIFTLAFRNVRRNPRRTILTVAGIVAGIMCIMILGGYYEFNYWGLRESFIRSQYAHVQIAAKGFWDKQEQEPFAFAIPRYKELLDFLDSLEGVETVSPHLSFFAVLDTTAGGDGQMVLTRGVIPERENMINTFFTRKSGHDLFDDDYGSAELGYLLAEKSGLKPDDSFYLSTIDATGMQNALPLQVKSIIGSYSQEFDSRIVRVPLQTAQILANTTSVQEIIILLDDTNKTDSFKIMLEKKLHESGWDLDISTWQEHAGYYAQVVRFYGNYFSIILFVVIIVAFFSTLNTMVMSIFERITEIGTLRSFGTLKSRILMNFTSEGFIIGIFGTMLGLIFSQVLAWVIQAAGGIPMPPPPGVTTNVFVQIMITPGNIIISCCIGIVVPMIAALIPAIKTINAQIIDQIRTNVG